MVTINKGREKKKENCKSMANKDMTKKLSGYDFHSKNIQAKNYNLMIGWREFFS